MIESFFQMKFKSWKISKLLLNEIFQKWNAWWIMIQKLMNHATELFRRFHNNPPRWIIYVQSSFEESFFNSAPNMLEKKS